MAGQMNEDRARGELVAGRGPVQSSPDRGSA
jgi:hypothetical protein